MPNESRTIETRFGPIELKTTVWGETILNRGSASLRLDFADRTIPEDGYRARLRSHAGSVEALRDIAAVTAFAAELIDLLVAANEEAIEEARREEERRREEREKEEAERREVVKKRTEQVMTEFFGEEVKVREAGFQTMRRAIVDVRLLNGVWEPEGGDYVEPSDEEARYGLRLNYIGKDVRTENVERMKRLDVKKGSRWYTVWDDGTDDLSPWESLSRSAAPTGRMYDGTL